MLLLFWNLVGINIGLVTNIKWFHDHMYSPRFFCLAQEGMSIINPYADPNQRPECSFITSDVPLTDATYYNNNILIGSTTGVKSLGWDTIKRAGCFLNNPEDLTIEVSESYNTSSGILSDEIIAIDSLNNYLAILTTSGLSWTSNESFVNYLTTSGSKVSMTNGPRTYLADGDTLRLKIGEISDFSSWDEEYYIGREITSLHVNQYNGIDTLFCATASGLVMIEGENIYDFSNTLSGSLELTSVATEYDSSFNWGHAFTGASGIVNIINLKHKTIENTIEYDGQPVLAVDYPRIYSR